MSFIYIMIIFAMDIIKIFRRQYEIYKVHKIVDYILTWILVSPVLVIVFGGDLWLFIYSVQLNQFQIMIKDKTIEENFYLKFQKSRFQKSMVLNDLHLTILNELWNKSVLIAEKLGH